jgi:uncharacterized protein with HEPN domain
VKKDDRVYLLHIPECARRIEEDLSDGPDRFLNVHTIQDAVLRNLQVMSESSQRLSDAAKMMHPKIEWQRIAAFRNILVHDYLGIDLDTVLDVTQRDVPELKKAAEQILQTLDALKKET